VRKNAQNSVNKTINTTHAILLIPGVHARRRPGRAALVLTSHSLTKLSQDVIATVVNPARAICLQYYRSTSSTTPPRPLTANAHFSAYSHDCAKAAGRKEAGHDKRFAALE
jgi:hypothetical protein